MRLVLGELPRHWWLQRRAAAMVAAAEHRSTPHRPLSTSPIAPTPTPVALHSMEYPSLHSSSSSSPSPPFLIAHGLLGSATNWAGICRRPQLCSTHRCVAVDLRNHAQSPHSPSHTFDDMAADLIALLDRKRIDRCIGLGHSLGGKAMMAAALRYPSRFAGLVVVDIAPFDYNVTGTSWSGVSHVVHALNAVDLSAATSRADVDQQLRPLITHAATRGFVLQNVVPVPGEVGRVRWRLNLPVLTARLPYFSTFPFAPPRPALALPTLFVKGGHSDFITDRQRPSMAHFFPHHEDVTIANAAHWVHADQPQAFVEAVETFLHKHHL